MKPFWKYKVKNVSQFTSNFTCDNTCWRRCVERGTLLHCWWDCKLVQPHWKSTWRFLRKLEVELPEDPAEPLLGIYPKDASPCHRGTRSMMFIAALFVIARTGNNPDALIFL
jgi:hypothetical protein